jgi:hypothetical protein
MVYSTQNYWVFLDIFHRPVFWELENTTFRAPDLFPYSVQSLDEHMNGNVQLRTSCTKVNCISECCVKWIPDVCCVLNLLAELCPSNFVN